MHLTFLGCLFNTVYSLYSTSTQNSHIPSALVVTMVSQQPTYWISTGVEYSMVKTGSMSSLGLGTPLVPEPIVSIHQSGCFSGMDCLCPASIWHLCFAEPGLWYATVCLISPQREQMDSYRGLNKGDCSSERVLLSNKYRISWMLAKLEQVFYRLVGTHFFPLPGDSLELEGEKQPVLLWETLKDSMFLKVTRLEAL